MSGTEEKSVNLLCNYGTSSTGFVDLYWFRQYPNQALEYILHRGWGYTGKGDASFATGKFYSESTANATSLHIRTLVPADTALYHCALREARRQLCIGQLYKNTGEEGKESVARVTTLTSLFFFCKIQQGI